MVLDMQPVLREWKHAAGGTYHAVLRHEITTRLGWAWHQPRYGMAELARWPKPVLRVFSRRREQIEARFHTGKQRAGTSRSLVFRGSLASGRRLSRSYR